jgi:triacylglycerol lipase
MRTVPLLVMVAIGGCAGQVTPEAAVREPDSIAPPLGPDPDLRPEKLAGSHARYPIVLVHGFSVTADNGRGFYRVAEGLSGDGHAVYVAWVPPIASVSKRAAALRQYVDLALQDQAKAGVAAPKVNLVAHSQGGLDARELISVLGYGDRVASLTTISTPHRGMALADFVLGSLPGDGGAAYDVLAVAFGDPFARQDLATGTDLRAALADMSEASSNTFSSAHPDDPRVYYQSYAGISNVFGIRGPQDLAGCDGQLPNSKPDVMNALLVPSAAFVAHFVDRGQLSPNDGLVAVQSAKWGHFRGCVPADHFDEVGQVRHDARDSRTGFDHIRFYRNLGFDLLADGY